MSVYQSSFTLHSLNSKHWRERTLRKDLKLRKRYADKIRYDLRKGYDTTVEPHDISKPSDRETIRVRSTESLMRLLSFTAHP